MEKINTIGKTITGLSVGECSMIITALREKANRFKEMSLGTNKERRFNSLMTYYNAYNQLADFIESEMVK